MLHVTNIYTQPAPNLHFVHHTHMYTGLPCHCVFYIIYNIHNIILNTVMYCTIHYLNIHVYVRNMYTMDRSCTTDVLFYVLSAFVLYHPLA